MAGLRGLGGLVAIAISLAASAPVPVAAASSAPDAFSRQVRLGFHSGDDWEPAIAADRFGHVYVLYKHYDVAGGGTCARCHLRLLLQRSDDSGGTWSHPVPIAPGTVAGGQFDSQLAVDPIDGRTVWASFMQGSKAVIQVVRSVDFGHTWSTPVTVSPGRHNKDKDLLAVRGNLVVVAYDDGFNTWTSVSTDAGAHWHQRLVFAGSKRFGISLAGGAGIDSRGRIFVAWNGFDKAHANKADGPVTLWVTRSEDGGVTWDRTIVAVSGAPPACTACGWDYLGAQMALAVGVDGVVYVLWHAAPRTAAGAPERVFFSRSIDHGASYAPAVGVSTAPPGTEHAFPAIATGRAPGEVGISWMDTRTGAWNVFYRESRSGGDVFGRTDRVSGFVAGYPYLKPAGFTLPYGDYDQIVFGAGDRVLMAFGEGPSYAGPGNIWFSRQTAEG